MDTPHPSPAALADSSLKSPLAKRTLPEAVPPIPASPSLPIVTPGPNAFAQRPTPLVEAREMMQVNLFADFNLSTSPIARHYVSRGVQTDVVLGGSRGQFTFHSIPSYYPPAGQRDESEIASGLHHVAVPLFPQQTTQTRVLMDGPIRRSMETFDPESDPNGESLRLAPSPDPDHMTRPTYRDECDARTEARLQQRMSGMNYPTSYATAQLGLESPTTITAYNPLNSPTRHDIPLLADPRPAKKSFLGRVGHGIKSTLLKAAGPSVEQRNSGPSTIMDIPAKAAKLLGARSLSTRNQRRFSLAIGRAYRSDETPQPSPNSVACTTSAPPPHANAKRLLESDSVKQASPYLDGKASEISAYGLASSSLRRSDTHPVFRQPLPNGSSDNEWTLNPIPNLSRSIGSLRMDRRQEVLLPHSVVDTTSISSRDTIPPTPNLALFNTTPLNRGRAKTRIVESNTDRSQRLLQGVDVVRQHTALHDYTSSPVTSPNASSPCALPMLSAATYEPSARKGGYASLLRGPLSSQLLPGPSNTASTNENSSNLNIYCNTSSDMANSSAEQNNSGTCVPPCTSSSPADSPELFDPTAPRVEHQDNQDHQDPNMSESTASSGQPEDGGYHVQARFVHVNDAAGNACVQRDVLAARKKTKMSECSFEATINHLASLPFRIQREREAAEAAEAARLSNSSTSGSAATKAMTTYVTREQDFEAAKKRASSWQVALDHILYMNDKRCANQEKEMLKAIYAPMMSELKECHAIADQIQAEQDAEKQTTEQLADEVEKLHRKINSIEARLMSLDLVTSSTTPTEAGSPSKRWTI